MGGEVVAVDGLDHADKSIEGDPASTVTPRERVRPTVSPRNLEEPKRTTQVWAVRPAA